MPSHYGRLMRGYASDPDDEPPDDLWGRIEWLISKLLPTKGGTQVESAGAAIEAMDKVLSPPVAPPTPSPAVEPYKGPPSIMLPPVAGSQPLVRGKGRRPGGPKPPIRPQQTASPLTKKNVTGQSSLAGRDRRARAEAFRKARRNRGR